MQQISLDKNPSFQVAVQQMQNWFCGAYKPMAGEYTITQIAAHPMALQFVPKENAVARNFIFRVTIYFQDDVRYLKELRIEEKGGDTTALFFMNTRLNEAVPPGAWEVKADVR